MSRETQEVRLAKWPLLSTLPTTQALAATVIILAVGTYIAWMFKRPIPDGWYLFVGSLSTISAGQFTAKRITHKPENGNGNGGTP